MSADAFCTCVAEAQVAHNFAFLTADVVSWQSEQYRYLHHTIAYDFMHESEQMHHRTPAHDVLDISFWHDPGHNVQHEAATPDLKHQSSLKVAALSQPVTSISASGYMQACMMVHVRLRMPSYL